jgi:hypothetical protein
MEQPTFPEPADVITIMIALRDIELERVFSALPSDPEAVKATVGGAIATVHGGPRDHLAEHFTALQDFYTTAADHRLAVVLWCD